MARDPPSDAHLTHTFIDKPKPPVCVWGLVCVWPWPKERNNTSHRNNTFSVTFFSSRTQPKPSSPHRSPRSHKPPSIYNPTTVSARDCQQVMDFLGREASRHAIGSNVYSMFYQWGKHISPRYSYALSIEQKNERCVLFGTCICPGFSTVGRK